MQNYFFVLLNILCFSNKQLIQQIKNQTKNQIKNLTEFSLIKRNKKL